MAQTYVKKPKYETAPAPIPQGPNRPPTATPTPPPNTTNEVIFGNRRPRPEDIVTQKIGDKEFKTTYAEYMANLPSGHGKLPANRGAIKSAQAEYTRLNNPLAPNFQPQETLQQQEAQNLIGNLTPEQQALDVVQDPGVLSAGVTGAAGLAGATIGAKSGTALGATVGSVVPGVGTAAGAIGGGVIGGTAGFIGGVLTKVGYQKRQDVKEATTVFTAAKGNMGTIINKLNMGLMSPTEAAIAWNEELANFYSAERNIKQETDNELDRFLSNGGDEAAKIEAFKRTLPFIEAQLRQAMQMPNPNLIINLNENV